MQITLDPNRYRYIPDRRGHFKLLTKDSAENSHSLYVVLGEMVGDNAETQML
jgi:hypothetical protein